MKDVFIESDAVRKKDLLTNGCGSARQGGNTFIHWRSQLQRTHAGAENPVVEFGDLFGGKRLHAVDSRNNRRRVRRIAIRIGKVCGVHRKLQRLLEVPFAEPHGDGHDSPIEDGIVGGGIFDSPALVEGATNLFWSQASLRHGNHHVERLTVGRLRVDQRGGFADDRVRVVFGKRDADHAGDEDAAIGSFGITIDVGELARQGASHIGHAGRQRAIKVAAELRPNRPP